MKQGVDALDKIYTSSSDIGIKDRGLIWNTDLVEALEYDNLIAQAVVPVNSALAREESLAPTPARIFTKRDDDKWMKHSLMGIDTATGKVTEDFRPVHTYTMTNDIAYIAPKARVY